MLFFEGLEQEKPRWARRGVGVTCYSEEEFLVELREMFNLMVDENGGRLAGFLGAGV